MTQYERMERRIDEMSEYLREIVHLLRTRLELPSGSKVAYFNWADPHCEHGVRLGSPCHKCGRTL